MKPLLALAALLALAGCFGHQPGVASEGDTAAVEYAFIDPETGDAVDAGTASTVLGSGDFPLGDALAAQVVGMRLNETRTIPSPSAQRDYAMERRINATLDPIPAVDVVDVATYRSIFGEPIVGATFPLSFYQGVVLAFDNATVTYSLSLSSEEQRDAVPGLGVVLVSTVREGQLLRRLEPSAGAVFTIEPASPFNPQTPLGLEPGGYKMRGIEDGRLVLGFTPEGLVPFLGRDLVVRMTLIDLFEGEAVEPVDGNYAVRHSPQLGEGPGLEGHARAGPHA